MKSDDMDDLSSASRDRVNDLFDQALNMSAAAREAFLNGADAPLEVIARVRSLLGHHAKGPLTLPSEIKRRLAAREGSCEDAWAGHLAVDEVDQWIAQKAAADVKKKLEQHFCGCKRCEDELRKRYPM